MATNKDYYIEIGKQKPAILVNRKCQKCGSELGAIHPDRVWCVNSKCDHGELHIVGEGTRSLIFKK